MKNKSFTSLSKKLFGRLFLSKGVKKKSSDKRVDPLSRILIKQKLSKWVEEKGYLNECTLEDVATLLGIKPYALNKYCKHAYSKTFLSWRKQLRLEEACRLLCEETELSAAAVGSMVGYSDKSNFRRAFSETYGMTPAQWRAKNSR